MSRRALHGFDPARLKELRGEKGLSRSDLGRLSGVPYNTIRRWETETRPRLRTFSPESPRSSASTSTPWR
ncbi:helix-turn-helix domain-containing protein [Rhodococcus hoagii]|nr:helix-turn-helix domain-containing protein [Prescottella equi]